MTNYQKMVSKLEGKALKGFSQFETDDILREHALMKFLEQVRKKVDTKWKPDDPVSVRLRAIRRKRPRRYFINRNMIELAEKSQAAGLRRRAGSESELAVPTWLSMNRRYSSAGDSARELRESILDDSPA